MLIRKKFGSQPFRAYSMLLRKRIKWVLENVLIANQCRLFFFFFFFFWGPHDFCDLLKSLGRLDNKITIANVTTVMERPLMKADEKEERGGQDTVAGSQWLMSCFDYFVPYWQSVFEWRYIALLCWCEACFACSELHCCLPTLAVYWLGIARQR